MNKGTLNNEERLSPSPAPICQIVQLLSTRISRLTSFSSLIHSRNRVAKKKGRKKIDLTFDSRMKSRSSIDYEPNQRKNISGKRRRRRRRWNKKNRKERWKRGERKQKSKTNKNEREEEEEERSLSWPMEFVKMER